MLTDAQLGTIVVALAGSSAALGGFLRWGFLQWMSDRKEERADRKEERAEERADRKVERAEDRAITVENTRAMTTLAVRVEGLEKKLGDVAEDFESISDVHDARAIRKSEKKRARTSPLGVTQYQHTKPRKDDE